MSKAVVFDIDGMVLTGARFSEEYSKQFDVPIEKIAPFFKEPFDRCVLGHSDLKEELVSGSWLLEWQWEGSVDELLRYWFDCGNSVDERVLDSAAELRAKGIICILATNQEKYRAAYLRNTLGLAQHFDAMLVSCEVGFKKPNSEFFEKVTEFVRSKFPSAEKSDVIFWDDKPAHVEGAKAFGLDARLYTGFETFQRTNADTS